MIEVQNSKESEARSKPNVLQMIKNVFNEIAAVHAQAEAVAALMTRIAMERAQAHAAAAVEAKKMMMRSRLGDPLLRRDADTSEAKADAASKMALLKTLVCWGAVAATGEGKASRAHAPAVQATVRWRHRGPM